MFSLTVLAQETVNMKFGKPTKEEMEMTVYEADPQADAVVLCRLTNVNYTVQQKGYVVDYHEKFRIKVLKPSGARFAQVTIPYYILPEEKSGIHASKFALRTGSIEVGAFSSASAFDEAGGSLMEDAAGTFTDESVEDLKATAFNLVNGKTVKTNLNKKDVKTTQIDTDRWQVSFTIPNVKEGTVIEYEYSIHSQLFYMLHDWYAQCEIPVVYACLDMDIPNYLIFNIEEHGIQRLSCKCVPGVLRYKLESDPLAAPTTVKTNHYTCIGRNLKAMCKDDYVWNINDHCAGITAELKSYSLRGTMPLQYAVTWEQIDQMLLDDNAFGKQLDNHSPLRQELEAAKTANITDERQRMAAVCQLVLGKVKWDGTYTLWPTDKSSSTLKQETASNADINMLLIQSLRDAGLQAFPVVLRTRDEGLLPYNFPSISKLNTYVVAVKFSNGSMAYVDASSPQGSPEALKPQLLVERARLVAPGKKSQWANLEKSFSDKTSTVIDATLSDKGLLQGTQTTLHSGAGQEVKEVVPVSLRGEAQGDSISFSPYRLLPIKENPFVSEERLMPVEFQNRSSDQVIITVKLPEGYALDKTPEPIVVTTPDKGINGRLTTFTGEGKVEIHYQFNVNKTIHPSKNYAAIRDMFTLFAQHRQDMLVAKRK